ncbi:ATP-dependent helicase HrpB [Marinicrinis sediminis]|uniref:ATP-dependent helicase HrpB n=1 Tax=Marinicrinis sediminis TaxID=1652465 RepID=A0ABW5R4X2_9BACL
MREMKKDTFPVEEAIPSVMQALGHRGTGVLVAEPGAGKTTRVPLACIQEEWLGEKKILLLVPRRVAAKSAAHFMAAQRGEQVGDTVGYRIRLEQKISDRTRVEVVTTGVMLRMMQQDPTLDQYGLVIFDEFHERTLDGDLALGLIWDVRQVLREDLRILVMSATIAAEAVSELLGGAPVIRSLGRTYPVDRKYVPGPGTCDKELLDLIGQQIDQAYRTHTGDILVFLPGMKELKYVQQQLNVRYPLELGEGVLRCYLLHSSLSIEEQSLALKRCAAGTRKIVLATSIAETSVTIDGIQVVIDSGWVRKPQFSPRTGLSQLITTRISKAAADQRAGRAGRQGAGLCYRLWNEEMHHALNAYDEPEIRHADLISFTLELAWWGLQDASGLSLLDQPSSSAMIQARELLHLLGATDDQGKITEHGKDLAALGIHPRLSHMLLSALSRGWNVHEACDVAVVLQHQSHFSGGSYMTLHEIIKAFQDGPDERTYSQFRAESLRLQQQLTIKGLYEQEYEQKKSQISYDYGMLAAMAFPDRVAKNRGDGTFLLRSGRGAALARTDRLQHAPFLVAIQVEMGKTTSSIRLAEEVKEKQLLDMFEQQITSVCRVRWDEEKGKITGRLQQHLGAMVLSDTPVPLDQLSSERIVEAVYEYVTTGGIEQLSWNKKSRQLQQRIQFMHAHDPRWPDVSDEGLLKRGREWWEVQLDGLTNLQQLKQINVWELLQSTLDWEQSRRLETEAPVDFEVPSGSRIRIDYSDPDQPVMAVKLQELFGLSQTPTLGSHRIPVTLHLLSPAMRPVQITRDLKSFWEQTYFEVRKDLKGKYPKHPWPDHPMEAQATRRTKAAMEKSKDGLLKRK